MSWFSDRWGSGPSIKGLESSIKGTGHTIGEVANNPWTKTALAAALAATGVGAPAAAALLAGEGALGGALKPGGNFGSTLLGGGEGALAGGAAGMIGSKLAGAASDIPGVGGIENALGGAAHGVNSVLNQIPGVSGLESGVGGALKGALGGAGGGGSPFSVSSLLGDAGKFLTGNNGANALGLGEGVNAAMLGKQSTDYAKQAAQAVNDAYTQRAPLRVAGVAGMTNALRGNPFATNAAGAPNRMAPTPVRSLYAGGGLGT